MQSNENLRIIGLNIYPAFYIADSHCYYAANSMIFTKIQQNNIPLREPLHQPALQPTLSLLFPTANKIRLIFAEQMLYLTMISELQDYKQLHRNQGKQITRDEFESMKERDIITIHQQLDEVGYDKLEVMHFYLKMRKKSKILHRYYDDINDQLGRTAAIFKIYTTVGDFKSKTSHQNILVVPKEQSITTLLIHKSTFPSHLPLKIYITSNLDGVLLASKSPMHLTT